MNNKLQNIKAVKQLLSGEHKSQKKTSIYTGNLNKEKEVIEKDKDGNPKIWVEIDLKGFRTKVTQHDGFRTREPENSILNLIQDTLRVPDNCPECDIEMRNEEKMLNFKFWFSRKKCFGCVLKEERKIKLEGEDVWKEYQNKIMSSNADAWFKDVDKEVEIIKEQVVKTWQNAQGEYGEADMSDYLEKIEADYKKLKENLKKRFKG
ncbi:MAG: hypothetical protein H8E55_39505 [Pelagibacterales bacterium]|nr:hypothetical protein [Pelagibacterales bacterium]